MGGVSQNFHGAGVGTRYDSPPPPSLPSPARARFVLIHGALDGGTTNNTNSKHVCTRRKMLSLHKLDASLTQLDRMIAWADNAADDANAKDAGALGNGLPMSEIGLSEWMECGAVECSAVQ